MKNQPFLRTFGILLVLVLLATSLAACRKPASTPPPSATVKPTEGMGIFDQAGAQTAVPTARPTQVPAEPPTDASQPTETPVPAQPEAQQPAQPEVQQPAQPEVQQPAQPSAPQVELPKATPGIPQTYTLQKGEYPYCIARRFDVDPGELLALNGLGPSSVVNPGKELRIPQTGHPFITDRALKQHPTTYTVAAGDTIYTIACGFGDVSPDMIALANGLTEPYNLKAGDKLTIP